MGEFRSVAATGRLTGYQALLQSAITARRSPDVGVIGERLTRLVIADRATADPKTTIRELEHRPATYLFAESSAHESRTLLVVGRPQPPEHLRDNTYQHGYPLPDNCVARALDRGHFLPYSGGGLYGPNLLDRALNRGWSREGRRYRGLERLAVSQAGSLMWVRPIYTDDTAMPAELDVGVVLPGQLAIDTFRNRYDPAAVLGQDILLVMLAGATDAQIGALGEETAAVLLESKHEAIIVHLGDAGLERDHGRQHLDLLAAIDDAFVAVEVKTRYISTRAGLMTLAGNFPRPQLRSSPIGGGNRQGRREYVSARLGDWFDLADDYRGVERRLIAVDLVAMLAQQFAVDDAGHRLRPLGPPEDCADAARVGLQRILDHRG